MTPTLRLCLLALPLVALLFFTVHLPVPLLNLIAQAASIIRGNP